MSENDRRRAAIVAAWTAAWDEGDVDAMDACGARRAAFATGTARRDATWRRTRS